MVYRFVESGAGEPVRFSSDTSLENWTAGEAAVTGPRTHAGRRLQLTFRNGTGHAVRAADATLHPGCGYIDEDGGSLWVRRSHCPRHTDKDRPLSSPPPPPLPPPQLPLPPPPPPPPLRR